MTTDYNSPEKAFPAPQGSFTYLDNTELIKIYPDLKRSYLIVRKDGIDHHLFVFDYESNELILTEEIKGILKQVYPSYQILMEETFKEGDMDFEKISFGIALGMRVFETYKEPMIYFRGLYTYSKSHGKKFPIGFPRIPKDNTNLGFIFRVYDQKGRKTFVYDGYIFPEEVLEILLNDYQIIEPGELPELYKGKLCDVWTLKGKP